MYDIIFIGNTDDNYKKIKNRFPIAKTAKDFQHAQKISMTEFFWVVWNDCVVADSFDFSYTPDNWSKDYIHVFLNGKLYDGVLLVPKNAKVSDREITHRFFVNKKEVPILASNPLPYDYFEISSYDEYLNAMAVSKTDLFWMSSPNIKIHSDFDFTINYDRNVTHAFVHTVNNNDYYNGLFLCSKNKPLTKREVEYRFPVERTEWLILASGPVAYDRFNIDTYEEYQYALENSKTEMFWMTSNNISVNDEFLNSFYVSHDEYDRNVNHAFIHKVNNEELRNGVFLLSKKREVSEKEIEHRFIVNAKEWGIVASGPVKYDVFNISTYDEYLSALETSKTEMFWIIPNYVIPTTRFQFDTYFSHDQVFDRKINHAYQNGKYTDGIVLCSKHSRFSKKEFDYRFIANKKEVHITISTPKPYDIVFISYQEPNADQNYKFLTDRYPRAKRIHGVTGIHQAHIEAAKLCSSDLFWIVDGDALIASNFKFDYQVARWDKEIVHVWRSINPINDLVYGYGGVKLFPTDLTLNMDVSKPDMTTSISSKFKAVNEISNMTAFNTDPFNTWKSAFRECSKLSAKVIDRQKDDETQERLQVWCSKGIDRPFGKYALEGAKAGALYGARNKNNVDKIKLINNFEWLEEQFKNANI